MIIYGTEDEADATVSIPYSEDIHGNYQQQKKKKSYFSSLHRSLFCMVEKSGLKQNKQATAAFNS